MARRRWWAAAALLTLTACSGAATSDLTPPRRPPVGRRAVITSPWGPVVAPGPLVATARAYYDGAGPAPEDIADGRPACDLVLPTSLAPTALRPVPTSRFNVFGEFVVSWTLTGSADRGLTLTVLPAGDPGDRGFYSAAAQVETLADGSQVRTTPSRPRATLLRIVTENCEYELEPGSGIPESGDAAIVASLRLVFAP
ncbi:MAG TPA: hypothetical protein VG869_01450 [Acidimicrobiia bacterium]|jgi:hypothetical protein|nr:hypothetical protein [Acidimicrobiia bacterium]